MKMKRIKNKSQARKLFNEGKDIYIIPCNTNPEFGEGSLLKKINKAICRNCELTFEGFIDAYSYYNCSNSNVGNYVAYYIKEE